METHTEFNPTHEHSEGNAERREAKERFYSLAAIREYMRQTDDLSINAMNRTRARIKSSPPRELREALSALDVKRLAGGKDIDEEEIQGYKNLLMDLLTYVEILTRRMDTGLDQLTKEAQQERRERLCREALEEFYALPWDLFKTKKGTLVTGSEYRGMPLVLMYNSSSQIREYLVEEHHDLPMSVKRRILMLGKMDFEKQIGQFDALLEQAKRDYPLLEKSIGLQHHISKQRHREAARNAIREYAKQKLNVIRKAFMNAIPSKQRSLYRAMGIKEITEQFAQAIQRLEQGETNPTDEQLIHALHTASQKSWERDSESQAFYAQLSHHELATRLTETIASIELAAEPGDEARKEKTTTDASLDSTRKTGNELVDAYRDAVAMGDDARKRDIQTRFIAEYRDMLLNFCKSLLRKYPVLTGQVGRGGFEKAEDFFHEFLGTGYETTGGRMHNLLLNFKEGNFGQYAYAVLSNFAIDMLHAITRITEMVPAERREDDEPSAIDLYPSATRSPEEETVEALSLAERRKLTEEVLSHHPKGEKEFRLLMEGYTYQEIAEMLSMSENTVKIRVHRMKTQIRELAQKRGMLE